MPHDATLEACRLEIVGRRLADALAHGSARSTFTGAGMEPRGIRRYASGDDARAIDWRVTARRGELHVRELEEERELEVLLLFDTSASLHPAGTSRVGLTAIEVAAALARVAQRDGHRVGLVTFAAGPRAVIRPSHGRGQIARIVQALEAVEHSGEGQDTDLVAPLDLARALLTGHGLVLVVSDFIVRDTCDAVAKLVALHRRHEVVPIFVRGWRPSHPRLGPVRVADPEGGQAAWIDLGDVPPADRIADTLRDLGVPPLLLDPGRPLVPQLAVRFGPRRGGQR